MKKHIAALQGKVLMDVSYGCPWHSQIPETDVAYQRIWLKLAHENIYVESRGGEICVGNALSAHDGTSVYWCSRNRFEL
ncbi:MAG: hypothetical protein WC701_12170 [Kiritimatiellales bacterium]|jgi:hypothetical protein